MRQGLHDGHLLGGPVPCGAPPSCASAGLAGRGHSARFRRPTGPSAGRSLHLIGARGLGRSACRADGGTTGGPSGPCLSCACRLSVVGCVPPADEGGKHGSCFDDRVLLRRSLARLGKALDTGPPARAGRGSAGSRHGSARRRIRSRGTWRGQRSRRAPGDAETQPRHRRRRSSVRPRYPAMCSRGWQSFRCSSDARTSCDDDTGVDATDPRPGRLAHSDGTGTREGSRP